MDTYDLGYKSSPILFLRIMTYDPINFNSKQHFYSNFKIVLWWPDSSNAMGQFRDLFFHIHTSGLRSKPCSSNAHSGKIQGLDSVQCLTFVSKALSHHFANYVINRPERHWNIGCQDQAAQNRGHRWPPRSSCPTRQTA